MCTVNAVLKFHHWLHILTDAGLQLVCILGVQRRVLTIDSGISIYYMLVCCVRLDFWLTSDTSENIFVVTV